MERKRRKGTTQSKEQLKKYRVTILPTFGPTEVEAKSPEEAEELANHHWDLGWDGQFIAEFEEVKDEGGQKKS